MQASRSRSAYYKWLKWKPSIRELEILSLAKEVKLRYDKRKGVLGYRQIRTQLNRKLKKSYNKKRYYRIMRALEQSGDSQETTELREILCNTCG
ncbi:IS3 family transposase [Paenibacillus larvae]|nr:IS3 family transposase [Paenibacillus larvae]MDT2236850.1 IS3 family transposase [Paenibacillus larvae]